MTATPSAPIAFACRRAPPCPAVVWAPAVDDQAAVARLPEPLGHHPPLGPREQHSLARGAAAEDAVDAARALMRPDGGDRVLVHARAGVAKRRDRGGEQHRRHRCASIAAGATAARATRPGCAGGGRRRHRRGRHRLPCGPPRARHDRDRAPAGCRHPDHGGGRRRPSAAARARAGAGSGAGDARPRGAVRRRDGAGGFRSASAPVRVSVADLRRGPRRRAARAGRAAAGLGRGRRGAADAAAPSANGSLGCRST